MKRIILVFFIFSINSFAQESNGIPTKFDSLISKKGVFIKFIDTPIHRQVEYEEASMKIEPIDERIRQIIINNESHFFYQITKKTKIKDITASIAYPELIEIVKSIQTLKISSEVDLQNLKQKSNNQKSNIIYYDKYLQNKFSTNDGFEIGYYIDDKKTKWFITLQNWGTDKTILYDRINVIEQHFIKAKELIEYEQNN